VPLHGPEQHVGGQDECHDSRESNEIARSGEPKEALVGPDVSGRLDGVAADDARPLVAPVISDAGCAQEKREVRVRPTRGRASSGGGGVSVAPAVREIHPGLELADLDAACHRDPGRAGPADEDPEQASAQILANGVRAAG